MVTWRISRRSRLNSSTTPDEHLSEKGVQRCACWNAVPIILKRFRTNDSPFAPGASLFFKLQRLPIESEDNSNVTFVYLLLNVQVLHQRLDRICDLLRSDVVYHCQLIHICP